LEAMVFLTGLTITPPLVCVCDNVGVIVAVAVEIIVGVGVKVGVKVSKAF